MLPVWAAALLPAGALTRGISGSVLVAKKKSLKVAALPSHLLLLVLIRNAKPPCLQQNTCVEQGVLSLLLLLQAY
jgi:hypothetical protein